ncbi:hypothetical protein [Sphaerisporangium aureirubrum]|uniref:Transcriptional repressor PaaX-like central Cas2-like domain-containing protein n=1 Tax=Sphaerisporangium aureirubrum TaxID=1544736 RepID=A0ABW1NKQ8_9ACTN
MSEPPGPSTSSGNASEGRFVMSRRYAAGTGGVRAVVLARVAETNRAGRHLLRTRLRWSGFGNPAPGRVSAQAR